MTNLLKNILLFVVLTVNFQLFSVQLLNDNNKWDIEFINNSKIKIVPKIKDVQYRYYSFEVSAPEGFIFMSEDPLRNIDAIDIVENSNNVIITGIYIHKEDFNLYRVYSQDYVCLGDNLYTGFNLEKLFELGHFPIDYWSDSEDDTENYIKKAKNFYGRNKESIISGVSGFVLGIISLKLFQETKKTKKNKDKKALKAKET